ARGKEYKRRNTELSAASKRLATEADAWRIRFETYQTRVAALERSQAEWLTANESLSKAMDAWNEKLAILASSSEVISLCLGILRTWDQAAEADRWFEEMMKYQNESDQKVSSSAKGGVDSSS